MSKHLLIVESPTKTKTISKYLGPEYQVLSSFGHIRDLPKSAMGIDIEHGTFEPSYAVPTKSKQNVTALRKAAKEADVVYLATDADREGEAIAWHVAELLKLDQTKGKRITFQEITKNAIEKALESPRWLDMNLVNAQQARRILDRLVGYELSPLLWKKIRRGLSAGRVQSIAVRFVVEREREREAFVIEEYWSIDALFEKDQLSFEGKLFEAHGKKLEKLSIKNQEEADAINKDLEETTYTVTDVKKKEVTKAPPTPFTTSSLQMEANSKLGYSAKQTMMLAQSLYETGSITYMRTDSLTLSDKFLQEAQEFIRAQFGATYTTGIKQYKTKKKGAQEAHEAIRPTNIIVTPEQCKTTLEPKQWKLYDLIWRRTIASQLPDAKLERTAVDIQAKDYLFRASGNMVTFDGFMKIYQPSKEKLLPALTVQDSVALQSLKPTQHFTEPPARYSDATLVKALEEHEIGRPSTYAPTISTIIDRGYVERDEHKKLAPTDVAKIVNDFLVEHFPNIVDYAFTAKMENDLDSIAEGKIEWVPMLKQFYQPFHESIEVKGKEVKREDIMPDRLLGEDSASQLPVFVRTGSYGAYVQLGEAGEKGEEKPKRTSLLRGMNYESITLQEALGLLSLPRLVGKREDGTEMVANIGRFGPYLKAGEVTASIKEPLSPVTITLEESRTLLQQSEEQKKAMMTPLAELGIDPETKAQILIKNGRYGPYVTDGTTNASIGRKTDPVSITQEKALELLAKKRVKNTKPKK
ncbi:TPA: type I DNA topoisomerase [Candidatus Uhrbacteria bacterium]|nr:type I DNA topoisomerase [Candidatus Uhrbacteria bacterium]